MSDNVAGLRAIEREVVGAAIAPTARAPEVESMLQAANAVAALVNQRDQFEYENEMLRQRLAALEGEFAQFCAGSDTEHARKDALIEEITRQRDCFCGEADELRNAVDAAQRTLERARDLSNRGYEDRSRQKRAATFGSYDDAPPAIVTDRSMVHGNITQIKTGRPFRG